MTKCQPQTGHQSWLSTYAEAGNAAAAKQARYYFGLDANPTPSDIAAIAEHYPVFRITYDT